MTSASTSTSTRAAARSRASGPTPDRGDDSQTSPLVFRRERVADSLLDVLDGDEAFEAPVRIDDRKLLDLVPTEDGLRLSERGPDGRGDKIATRHHDGDRLRGICPEPEVAIGEDADQDAGGVGDRDTRDAVASHQLERVADERVRWKGDGLDDHACLRALHLVDLGHLVGDRKVAVQDTDPALSGERNRKPGLGDRVHRGGDDRDLERDRPRQPGDRRDVVREDVRLGRNEQHVIEGQTLLRELVLVRPIHRPTEGTNRRGGRRQRRRI